MPRIATLGAMLLSALLFSTGSFAQQSGSAAEARAMLERAVVAVKKDRTTALAAFNSGTGGFRDRDLYVFCTGRDGVIITHANPAMLGVDLSTLKDPTGKAFGKEILSSAREGQITAVSYAFPRPGESQPVAKESYITKVGDLVCGVGHYK
ncbi:MAG: cache domain-containing protein [Xanthobacteraceae bacterium]